MNSSPELLPVSEDQPKEGDGGPRMACLRDVMLAEGQEYKPAATLMDLENQIVLCAQFEVEMLEATEAVLKYFAKRNWEKIKETGYLVYRGIKVVIDGRVDEILAAEEETIEDRLFASERKKA